VSSESKAQKIPENERLPHYNPYFSPQLRTPMLCHLGLVTFGGLSLVILVIFATHVTHVVTLVIWEWLVRRSKLPWKVLMDQVQNKGREGPGEGGREVDRREAEEGAQSPNLGSPKRFAVVPFHEPRHDSNTATYIISDRRGGGTTLGRPVFFLGDLFTTTSLSLLGSSFASFLFLSFLSSSLPSSSFLSGLHKIRESL
jgi:hypothetical protein